ncbi:hypothetical protein N7475_006875 [Penicillium sp. IBT 31633x]|nr:hypothetical protein N7475_006875 [Penicillium sp. IBT 31633x]
MTFDRPLPISGAWEHHDAYIEALLGFTTTSVLFMNLCGGVHMVDFLTREPDLYTQVLPKDWIFFFEQHDTQDIIRLLLREDIEHLRGADESSVDQSSGTWNGGAFPPQSLLDYIFNIRLLTLQREMHISSSKRVELPKQVAMHMNRKKAHEVECLSQHLASLSDTVTTRRGEPVTHIVDFGSGQNYLGRTLASSPYYKHVIAIERKHQYISGAKSMDVRAKLAKNPKAQYFHKVKISSDGNGTPEVTISETTDTSQPTIDGPSVADVPFYEMLSIQSDELLGSTTKSPVRERLPKPEVHTGGTLSYIEHEIQDGYLEPIIDHIIHPSPAGASDEKEKEESDARVMVVSLHSCGNLVHHGLRSLILNPSIVAVAMIGCCYNLLTERLGPNTHELPILQSLHPRLKETGASYDPHGFPMSKYYENYRSPGATSGVKLNITARALAVQAPYKWGVNDSEASFTRHFFRALLQRILVDRSIVPRPSVPEDASSDGAHSESRTNSIILGALPKSAYKSFTAYVRAATIKMSRDPIYGSQVQEHIATLTDEEIHCYETQYHNTRKHMSIMWSLMAFSAQLIEAIIVVDRWQFLREQDLVKDCWVQPVFDYSESPRNLAVFGLRK